MFLHGFALLGNSYQPLGTRWAEQGFVVVLSNTTQFDNLGQEADGRALFPALLAANAAAGGPVSRTARGRTRAGGARTASGRGGVTFRHPPVCYRDRMHANRTWWPAS